MSTFGGSQTHPETYAVKALKKEPCALCAQLPVYLLLSLLFRSGVPKDTIPVSALSALSLSQSKENDCPDDDRCADDVERVGAASAGFQYRSVNRQGDGLVTVRDVLVTADLGLLPVPYDVQLFERHHRVALKRRAVERERDVLRHGRIVRRKRTGIRRDGLAIHGYGLAGCTAHQCAADDVGFACLESGHVHLISNGHALLSELGVFQCLGGYRRRADGWNVDRLCRILQVLMGSNPVCLAGFREVFERNERPAFHLGRITDRERHIDCSVLRQTAVCVLRNRERHVFVGCQDFLTGCLVHQDAVQRVGAARHEVRVLHRIDDGLALDRQREIRAG